MNKVVLSLLFLFLFVICANAAYLYTDTKNNPDSRSDQLVDLTTPGGAISASYKVNEGGLIDGDVHTEPLSNQWKPTAGDVLWFSYDFGDAPQIVNTFVFYPICTGWYENSMCPKRFKIFASNNQDASPSSQGSEWIELFSEEDSQIKVPTKNQLPWNRFVFTFPNSMSYRKYKVEIYENYGYKQTFIQEIELCNTTLEGTTGGDSTLLPTRIVIF